MKTRDMARVVLRQGNAISPYRGVLGLSDLVTSADGKIASVAPYRADSRWPHASKVLDLNGFTVVPGLIDVHFHMLATGTQLLTIDLAAAKSVHEVIELLEARGDDSRSEWLIAGHLGDEHPGARLPTLTELDHAFPRRSVFLEHRSCHFALCNTRAMKRLRLRNRQAAAHGSTGRGVRRESTPGGQPCSRAARCNDSPRNGRWGPVRRLRLERSPEDTRLPGD